MNCAEGFLMVATRIRMVGRSLMVSGALALASCSQANPPLEPTYTTIPPIGQAGPIEPPPPTLPPDLPSDVSPRVAMAAHFAYWAVLGVQEAACPDEAKSCIETFKSLALTERVTPPLELVAVDGIETDANGVKTTFTIKSGGPKQHLLVVGVDSTNTVTSAYLTEGAS